MSIMIITLEDTIKNAVKETFIKLYKNRFVTTDPELWKEESATIVVTNTKKEEIDIKILEKKLSTKYNFQKHFPFIDKKIVQVELDYWATEFINAPRLDQVREYLKNNLQSKRAIINLWNDEFRDLNLSCPCATYLYFRKKGKFLEMHSHMRANNTSFLLFMDMYLLSGIHKYLAESLNLVRGSYIHFVDSLHFYRKELKSVRKQYTFMNYSNEWKK